MANHINMTVTYHQHFPQQIALSLFPNRITQVPMCTVLLKHIASDSAIWRVQQGPLTVHTQAEHVMQPLDWCTLDKQACLA